MLETIYWALLMRYIWVLRLKLNVFVHSRVGFMQFFAAKMMTNTLLDHKSIAPFLQIWLYKNL